MKKFIFLATTCLLAFSLSAQFSATMVYTMSGKTVNFQIFSDMNRYRYEFNENGQEVAVISLNETGDFYMLMPQQKMAIKTKTTSQMSMSTDPLKQYEHFAGEGATEVIIGEESIDGYPCVKKELRNIQKNEFGESNQHLFTIWVSEEFNFPLKMVNHIDGTGASEMEVKDIKAWTPDEASFTVPAGFTIMDQAMMMPEQ
ncbi:MAG: DUF4412 domain-containing protein [Mariniphaga sp.]|nr:DUF4412 domain-containing protein [Mariniphaga sp.]